MDSYTTGQIKTVYNALGHLRDKVVFIGGATVSLYADRIAAGTRPTDDIDIVIELWRYAEFVAIDKQLRQMGFENDKESGIICRYKIAGIIVDVMPTQEKVLQFKNKWYPEGFTQAIDFVIDNDCTIKIFSAPYFIATKFDAFKDRGRNDGRTSSDFEDIIYILENRRIIWEELKALTGEIKKYMVNEFKALLNNPYAEEWIGCHVDTRASVSLIIDGLKKIVG